MATHRFLSVFVAFAATATIAFAGPAISTNGLIGYYDFNNASNVFVESTGNGYNGTIHNDTSDFGAAYVAYQAGHSDCIRFQNVSAGDCHGYASLPSLNYAMSNFSVAYWIYDTGLSSNAWVFNAAHTAGTGTGAVIRTSLRTGDSNYNNVNANTYELMLSNAADTTFFGNKKQTDPSYWTRNPSGSGVENGDPVNNVGKWVHIAETYDKNASDANYQCAIYVDGVLEMHHAAATSDDIGAWNQGAYIGATYSGFSSGYSLNGYLDDFYLFNRTITAGEVATLASTPEPSSMALVVAAVLSALAYWRRK